jgi:hypothetical protein
MNAIMELHNRFKTTIPSSPIHNYKHNELFKWATKIAGRYMGKKNAEAYGKEHIG